MESKLYIFSEAFYKKDYHNMNEFEKIVRKHIEGEMIPSSVLIDVYNKRYEVWNEEERYYYIPILINIINTHLSTFKTEL